MIEGDRHSSPHEGLEIVCTASAKALHIATVALGPCGRMPTLWRRGFLVPV